MAVAPTFAMVERARMRLVEGSTAETHGFELLDEMQYFDNIGNMKTETAIAALAALAQESRLAIFRYLVEAGPAGSTVGSIADALDLPAATLSFHLKELTRAALLDSQQEGRFIRYAANFGTMNDLVGYLTENCCGGKPELCGPVCPPSTSSAKTIRKGTPA